MADKVEDSNAVADQKSEDDKNVAVNAEETPATATEVKDTPQVNAA